MYMGHLMPYKVFNTMVLTCVLSTPWQFTEEYLLIPTTGPSKLYASRFSSVRGVAYRLLAGETWSINNEHTLSAAGS
jgi:hypothetical protein